jgi:L-ascorbate metabolism protein UlaG (beta-lactamase superfamily)
VHKVLYRCWRSHLPWAPAADPRSIGGVLITKFTHSCVRLETGGRVLVIDPGVWSEPGALLDADAVLVTHEHVDHIDVLRLAGIGAPVFAPADAEIGALNRVSGLDIQRVSAGDRFDAAGLRVRAVGGRHATIFDGRPDCANLGYLIEESLYHPGDSLFVPDQPVETLFVPIQASWLKTGEAIAFVRSVGPAVTIPIHEGQLNERGLSAINGWMAGETDHGYRWLSPRETV